MEKIELFLCAAMMSGLVATLLVPEWFVNYAGIVFVSGYIGLGLLYLSRGKRV